MRILLAVMLMFTLAACDNGPEPGTETIFSGKTMGTTFNVKVVDLPQGLTADTVRTQLGVLLKDVNDKMSLWVKDSEIIRFNQSTSTDWQDVSADLFKVTAAAQKISEQTDGRFDVTVEPLIKMWGFSTKDMTRVEPSESELNDALARIGYGKISLDGEKPALRKANPQLTINLSAIAKGFGIDKLSEYLESQGVENYMVEIGGDLRVKGTNARREPWRIAVETPDVGSRSVHSVIALSGVGMATSGDYRNYFEKDGKRFSHIIDPRTGRPITHNLASVTVLSETAMLADGWATAFLALGDVKGAELAEKYGIAAFFLVREGDGFVEKRSSRFVDYESKVQ